MENINAAFKLNEYIRALKAKDTVAFDVKVNDTVYKVVVQEYQKHPVTNQLLHVDLMIAQSDVIAQYYIPVLTTGTAKGASLSTKGVGW